MKFRLLFLLVGFFGCTPDVSVQPATDNPSKAVSLDAFMVDQKVDAAPVVIDPLAHRTDLDPAERVSIMVGGERRWVSRETASEHGFTVIDLSNDWVPHILSERRDAEGNVMENVYRQVFVDLANDRIDADGVPLTKEELNYLEVYGIPPSTGIIAQRMLADEEKACLRGLDYENIGKFQFIPVTNYGKRRQRNRIKKMKKRVARFEKKHGAITAEEARSIDASIALDMIELAAQGTIEQAFNDIEERLYCDLHVRKRFRHKKGRRDDGFQKAVRRFQRKHKLYVWGLLEEVTLAALAQPPQEMNYRAFVRAFRERLISATGILEDGSAQVKGKPAKFTAADGSEQEVPNLIADYVRVALKALELESHQQLLAFFQTYGVESFDQFYVGVRLPERPEYYSDHMSLSIEVDRGSVWYDFPYTDSGRPKRQRRKFFPTLNLMLDYNGKRFPLVSWRTTIGGWFEEMAENGYVYLKYKQSDVGKRILRRVVAAPTWRPPASTPVDTLRKRRWLNGKAQNVVSYGQLGPGYLSAFGLVAGYFAIEGKNGRPDWDKGIRAHGSSNYMSILSKKGYSHGCHRLQNDRAVRLYGFVLSHRDHELIGNLNAPYRQRFFYDDEIYEIILPSQGFEYRLTPPLNVEVLEGRIEGDVEEPIEDWMEIPGRDYPVPVESEMDAGIPANILDSGVEPKSNVNQPASDK